MSDDVLKSINDGLPAHRKVPEQEPEEPPSDPVAEFGWVTIRITAFSQVKMPWVSDKQTERILAGIKAKVRDIKLQSRGWRPIYTKTKPHTAFFHKDRRVTVEIDIPENYKVFLDSDRRNFPTDVEWIEGWDDMFSIEDRADGMPIVVKGTKP